MSVDGHERDIINAGPNWIGDSFGLMTTQNSIVLLNVLPYSLAPWVARNMASRQPFEASLSNHTPSSLNSIQFLRFVAAFGVTIYHAVLFSSQNISDIPRSITDPFAVGAAGVHIFFVISGFIMVWTTDGKFGDNQYVRKFAIKRFIRIFPIYWVLAAINIPILHLFALKDLSGWTNGVAAMLLLPGFSSFLIFVGWTLTFELFFYLVFGLLIPLQKRTALTAMTVLFFTLAVVGQLLGTDNEMLHVITNSLLLEFVAGAWIAELILSGKTISSRFAILLIATGVLAFAATAIFDFSQFPSVLYWGLPSICVVLGFLFLEAQTVLPKMIVRLSIFGDSSYSQYLLHAILIPPTTILIGNLAISSSSLSLVIAMLLALAVVAASHIVFLKCERPLISMTRRFVSGSQL